MKRGEVWIQERLRERAMPPGVPATLRSRGLRSGRNSSGAMTEPENCSPGNGMGAWREWAPCQWAEGPEIRTFLEFTVFFNSFEIIVILRYICLIILKYNSHSIHSTHLNIIPFTQSMAFSIFIELCNHHYN